jgi:signal transduction histidine kinase
MPLSIGQRCGLGIRLFALGALAALLVSALGGWALRQNVQDTLWNSFEQRLAEKAERLTSGLSVMPGETQVRWQGRNNDEFSRIFSGWYWQLESAGEIQASRSLWDSRLDIANARPLGRTGSLSRLKGPQDLMLMGIVRPIEIDGHPATLAIYGPASEIEVELAHLDRVLLFTQLGLVIALLATSLLQVRLGLMPLRRLRGKLSEVRAGTADCVGSHYSPDLDPLAEELNLVLARNAKIVTRARGHAADLSHALKKPLSILGADSALQEHPLLRQQISTMSRLIDRHLARAGSGAGSFSQIAVGERISGLIVLMQRLHPTRRIDWTCNIPPDLAWRGEPTDFEEMLGNLLDNAAKWARSRIVIEAFVQQHELFIQIDDDGPGLSAAQISESGIRGRRFDETIDGSGLGLAIASDIADTYGGDLVLEKSPMGGLRVTLKLPA